MILTGPEIKRLAEGGVGPNGERIVIDPFDPQLAGAASYDVFLGDAILVYDVPGYVLNWRWVTQGIIDPKNPPPTVGYEPAEGGRWLLWPGRVYLAVSREYTETHRMVPMLHGRSSVGRYGLFIHVTAGVGDPNFKGWWTMELVATEPVIVEPGMKIGQLVYHQTAGENQDYDGRYANQGREPVPSRYHWTDDEVKNGR